MQKVDAVIRHRLNSEVVLIRTIGDYIIHSGGKRLRPILVLLVAKAFGFNHSSQHTLAAIVEFIHTATLLHDDVVDDSDLRRGRQTANSVFGNPASVLVGDYLYSRAFEMMVEVDSMRIMQIMSEATTVIAEGEVLQLLNIRDPDVTEARYLEVVRFKTAKLFEAAAQAGAVLAGACVNEQQQAAAYGRHLGTAFQLIDDLLDYSGDQATLGKTVGDDLREGKPTLPIIRLLEVGSPQQIELVRHAIETGKGEFEAVAQAIHATDALQYTQKCAQAEVDLALQTLKNFPAGQFNDLLSEVACFSVSREA
jgi:octaprenyl-diphosphate synthase